MRRQSPLPQRKIGGISPDTGTASIRRDGSQTSERLLDSAERLFGVQGYEGVGMRELAAAARVNLGAATYYFGSKKALYVAVFMRRFRPSNAEQLSRLRKAEAEAGVRPLPVARIVDCMVRPTYTLGMAYPNFSALLTRNLMAPPRFLHAALSREFEPTLQAYLTALQKALPHIPVQQLRGRLMFAMGSLLMFSTQVGRLGTIHPLPTLESTFNNLARFISAGLQAAAGTEGEATSDDGKSACTWPTAAVPRVATKANRDKQSGARTALAFGVTARQTRGPRR